MLTRIWLWGAGMVIGLAGGSALLLRFDLLSPEPSFAAPSFVLALSLHVITALCAVVAIVLTVPSLLVPDRWRATGPIALGLWLVVSVLLVGGNFLSIPAPMASLLLRLMSVGIAVSAAPLLATMATKTPVHNKAATILFVIALGAIAYPLAMGQIPSKPFYLSAATALAAGVMCHPAMRNFASLFAFTVLPCLLCSWGSLWYVSKPAADFPLHDTTMAVAPLPTLGAVLLGTLLLTLAGTRAHHRRLLHFALGLVVVGATLTSFGFGWLGLQGMPRRYMNYDPEFSKLHVFVGIAAIVSCLGGILAIMALTAPRRAAPTA